MPQNSSNFIISFYLLSWPAIQFSLCSHSSLCFQSSFLSSTHPIHPWHSALAHSLTSLEIPSLLQSQCQPLPLVQIQPVFLELRSSITSSRKSTWHPLPVRSSFLFCNHMVVYYFLIAPINFYLVLKSSGYKYSWYSAGTQQGHSLQLWKCSVSLYWCVNSAAPRPLSTPPPTTLSSGE